MPTGCRTRYKFPIVLSVCHSHTHECSHRGENAQRPYCTTAVSAQLQINSVPLTSTALSSHLFRQQRLHTYLTTPFDTLKVIHVSNWCQPPFHYKITLTNKATGLETFKCFIKNLHKGTHSSNAGMQMSEVKKIYKIPSPPRKGSSELNRPSLPLHSGERRHLNGLERMDRLENGLLPHVWERFHWREKLISLDDLQRQLSVTCNWKQQ